MSVLCLVLRPKSPGTYCERSECAFERHPCSFVRDTCSCRRAAAGSWSDRGYRRWTRGRLPRWSSTDRSGSSSRRSAAPANRSRRTLSPRCPPPGPSIDSFPALCPETPPIHLQRARGKSKRHRLCRATSQLPAMHRQCLAFNFRLIANVADMSFRCFHRNTYLAQSGGAFVCGTAVNVFYGVPCFAYAIEMFFWF